MKIDPSQSIPTASSKSEEWIQWHKELKKIFGKKKANSIWVFAWAKRGGVNSPANTNALSSYMERQGVDVQRTSLEEIGESISEITGGVFNFGKIMFIGSMVVGGVVLVLILRALLKNPNKSIESAMMFTPQGRAVAGAKSISK